MALVLQVVAVVGFAVAFFAAGELRLQNPLDSEGCAGDECGDFSVQCQPGACACFVCSLLPFQETVFMKAVFCWCLLWCVSGSAVAAQQTDLTRAVLVTRGATAAALEQTAVQVLQEEVQRRTGILWATTDRLPLDATPAIVLTGPLEGRESWGNSLPMAAPCRGVRLEADGFCVHAEVTAAAPRLWVVSGDARGLLYAVGWLLRKLELRSGSVLLTGSPSLLERPAYALRGHQLGFRNRANSWDAWDDAQFDQHIRELALFGANAIENIPFQDDSEMPLAVLTRPQMNRRISEICQRYGLEHWVWVPAEFDLADGARTDAFLQQFDALCRSSARLDGIFFPGGDPGNNPPELVLPFLARLAQQAQLTHANSRVWLSLQGFSELQCATVFASIERDRPDWLGGLVHGPSSPDLSETRRRLPQRYPIRHYPDLTHCVRCQYPVPWWDPAFASTLGREPINPTPVLQKQIHNAFAVYTNGFLSYSDGCHDDVNKVIWTQLSWNPQLEVREILRDYARCFFGPADVEAVADGILALERNWTGSIRDNGGITGTLALWQQLQDRSQRLGNWRWEMCLLRAWYDAWVRERLLFESALERQAERQLMTASEVGAAAAIALAEQTLQLADSAQPQPQLRAQIVALCAALYDSCRLQTSVTKYQASGAERGAVLDFVDYPLNNRWWLEDQFREILALPTESARLKRLERICRWEHPGPGSYYEDIGHVGKSAHVIRGESPDTDPRMLRNPNPDFFEAGLPRARQSWHSKMDWPIGLRFAGLDPESGYMVRTTGFGQCLLRIDGALVKATLDGSGVGEFREFRVPVEALQDGVLLLTFDVPAEPHLNWRQQSRLTELWLLKQQ